MDISSSDVQESSVQNIYIWNTIWMKYIPVFQELTQLLAPLDTTYIKFDYHLYNLDCYINIEIIKTGLMRWPHYKSIDYLIIFFNFISLLLISIFIVCIQIIQWFGNVSIIYSAKQALSMHYKSVFIYITVQYISTLFSSDNITSIHIMYYDLLANMGNLNSCYNY